MNRQFVTIEEPVTVAVIGAQGFVGSAFVRHLREQKAVTRLSEVTRHNYEEISHQNHDIVIHCACNSKKYFAEENPFEEFDASVRLPLHGLRDFPAPLHVLISSVDVYADLSSPESTAEECTRHCIASTHYGFHKWLAEEIIRHYAKQWLIFRLGGMVGPGLKKNPVYDLLHGHPLRINPESRYQYMGTDDAARICWTLIIRGERNEVFNICGNGALSMGEIATILGVPLRVSSNARNSRPRVVEINVEKCKTRLPLPATRDSLLEFAKKCEPTPEMKCTRNTTTF